MTLHLFLLLSVQVHGQNAGATWMFGERCMIKFAQNGMIKPVPTPMLGSPLRTAEGCSLISDSCSGDVILSTDGRRVWNRYYQIIPGAEDLCGGTSSAQSAVIVPFPGHPGQFYIFTAPSISGPGYDLSDPPCVEQTYNYSIVDADANGGSGRIIAKNIQFTQSADEQIAATRDASGTGYWIVCLEPAFRRFSAFHLDSNGFASTPVYGGLPTAPIFGPGIMKISVQGNRIAIAGAWFGVVYDFDNATGIVSNERSIRTLTSYVKFNAVVPRGNRPYSCAFSPDGSKVYFGNYSAMSGGTRFCWGLYQFDLRRSNWDSVIESVHRVYLDSNRISRTDLGWSSPVLQLGIDGKLYALLENDMDVVEFPNERGSACGYQTHVIVYPSSCRAGASGPTLIDSDLGLQQRDNGCRAPWITFRGDTICQGESVQYTATAVNGSSAWHWEFPGGSPSVFDSAIPPRVTYPLAGTYVVRVRAANSVGWDQQEDSVVVLSAPQVTAGNDTVVCRGSTIRLQASGAKEYAWTSNATLTNSSSARPTLVALADSIRCTVIGTNMSGCSDTATMLIRTNIVQAQATADTLICSGAAATLSVKGGSAVLWTPSQSLSSDTGRVVRATPTATTRYTVRVTDSLGCTDTTSVVVTVAPLPTVVAFGDTTVCPNMNTLVRATGALQYRWSPAWAVANANAASTTARVPQTTMLVVEGWNADECLSRDSVILTVRSEGTVNAMQDTTICTGSNVAVRVIDASGPIEWTTTSSPTPLSSERVFTVRPETTTSYVVRITTSACSAPDTVTVFVTPKQHITAGPAATICEGDSVWLVATGGATYRWWPALGLSSPTGGTTLARPTVSTTYYVTDITTPCADTATVRIEVLARTTSTLQLTRDSVAAGDRYALSLLRSGPMLNASVTATLLFDGRLVSIDSIENATVLSQTNLGTPNATTTVALPIGVNAHTVHGRTFVTELMATDVIAVVDSNLACAQWTLLPGRVAVYGCGLPLRGTVQVANIIVRPSYDAQSRSIVVDASTDVSAILSLQLFNIIGETVSIPTQYELRSDTQSRITIPFADRSNGIYILHVRYLGTSGDVLFLVY